MKWLSAHQNYVALKRLRYSIQIKPDEAENRGMKSFFFHQKHFSKEFFTWQRGE